MVKILQQSGIVEQQLGHFFIVVADFAGGVDSLGVGAASSSKTFGDALVGVGHSIGGRRTELFNFKASTLQMQLILDSVTLLVALEVLDIHQPCGFTSLAAFEEFACLAHPFGDLPVGTASKLHRLVEQEVLIAVVFFSRQLQLHADISLLHKQVVAVWIRFIACVYVGKLALQFSNQLLQTSILLVKAGEGDIVQIDKNAILHHHLSAGYLEKVTAYVALRLLELEQELQLQRIDIFKAAEEMAVFVFEAGLETGQGLADFIRGFLKKDVQVLRIAASASGLVSTAHIVIGTGRQFAPIEAKAHLAPIDTTGETVGVARSPVLADKSYSSRLQRVVDLFYQSAKLQEFFAEFFGGSYHYTDFLHCGKHFSKCKITKKNRHGKKIMIIRTWHYEASERLNLNNTVQAKRSAVNDNRHLVCVSERRNIVYMSIVEIINKKAHRDGELLLRSLPDLNRSSRFCRPVPNPSAKRPFTFKKFCKNTTFPETGKIFFHFCRLVETKILIHKRLHTK